MIQRSTPAPLRLSKNAWIGRLIEDAVEPLAAFLPEDAVDDVRALLWDRARLDPVLRRWIRRARSGRKRVSTRGRTVTLPTRARPTRHRGFGDS